MTITINPLLNSPFPSIHTPFFAVMAQQPPAMQPSNMQIPQQPQTEVPPNSYYPEPPNDLTGGLPINLDSLRDGPPGSKPFYPYSTLIRYASFLSFCTFFIYCAHSLLGMPSKVLQIKSYCWKTSTMQSRAEYVFHPPSSCLYSSVLSL